MELISLTYFINLLQAIFKTKNNPQQPKPPLRTESELNGTLFGVAAGSAAIYMYLYVVYAAAAAVRASCKH